MRFIFGVCLVLVASAGQALCLRAGRRAAAREFPFVVKIGLDDYSWCLGIIYDPVRVIVPDECFRKSPLKGASTVDVIPLVNRNPRMKYNGSFVRSDPGEFYTEMDFIVIHLDAPGLILAEGDRKNLTLPKRVSIRQGKLGPSDVVVLGLNERVGVMTLLDDYECFNLLGGLYFPINDRLQSTKLLMRDKLQCAVFRNSTGSIGDIPPGQACERDLGSPVLQNGSVVGLLVRTFCLKYFSSVAIFTRVEPSDVEEKLSQNAVSSQSPSSRLLSNHRVKRVKRLSEVSEYETNISKKSIEGNEIQCHESSCEAPVVGIITSPEKVSLNTSRPVVIVPRATRDAIERQERLETNSEERKGLLLNSSEEKSSGAHRMHRVETSSDVVTVDIVEGKSVGHIRKRLRRNATEGAEPAANATGAASSGEEPEASSGKDPAGSPDPNPAAPAAPGVEANMTSANVSSGADSANMTAPSAAGGNATAEGSATADGVETSSGEEMAGSAQTAGATNATSTNKTSGIIDIETHTNGSGVAPIAGKESNETTGVAGSSMSLDEKDDENKSSTGGDKEAEDQAGVTQGSAAGSGEGDVKANEEIVLSGGDFELGLDRFGGSGNDTGSTDEDILSGFGQSGQDEIHESELVLATTIKEGGKSGPESYEGAKPGPKPPAPGAGSDMHEHEHEPEPVGPPEPNDDRPAEPEKPMPAVRQSFSSKNNPFNSPILVTIYFIISHL